MTSFGLDNSLNSCWHWFYVPQDLLLLISKQLVVPKDLLLIKLFLRSIFESIISQQLLYFSIRNTNVTKELTHTVLVWINHCRNIKNDFGNKQYCQFRAAAAQTLMGGGLMNVLSTVLHIHLKFSILFERFSFQWQFIFVKFTLE